MNTKNISVLFPKSHFSEIQLQRLEGLGKISFVESKSLKCPKDTEILVIGEDLSKSNLTKLLGSLPNLKYLVLGSSDFGYVNFDYCREGNIIVSFVPFQDARSKAEYVISLLLACSRRIIITDRRTYRRIYKPEPGFEVRGKKLGILGSGPIIGEVVQLAKAIGMTVYTTEHMDDSIRQPLDNLLHDSDLLTLHLPSNEESTKFLDKERIGKLKEGSIVVNIGNREWVDERAMNEALVSRKVDTYCFTAESMGTTPLKGNEYALMFKPSTTNTVETLEDNIEAMVRNIEGIVLNLPFSKVYF